MSSSVVPYEEWGAVSTERVPRKLVMRSHKKSETARTLTLAPNAYCLSARDVIPFLIVQLRVFSCSSDGDRVGAPAVLAYTGCWDR